MVPKVSSRQSENKCRKKSKQQNLARLFVTSFLEGAENIRLSHWLSDIGLPTAIGRITSPSKLHITWQFLGDLTEEQCAGVLEILKELRPALAEHLSGSGGEPICYNKIDFWPDRQKARVVVITPQAVSAPVAAMGELIRTPLQKYIEIDDTVLRNVVFMPHLTIMRLKENHPFTAEQWENYLTAIEGAFGEIAPVKQTISDIELIESQLSEKGGMYKRVFSLDLAKA